MTDLLKVMEEEFEVLELLGDEPEIIKRLSAALIVAVKQKENACIVCARMDENICSECVSELDKIIAILKGENHD